MVRPAIEYHSRLPRTRINKRWSIWKCVLIAVASIVVAYLTILAFGFIMLYVRSQDLRSQ